MLNKFKTLNKQSFLSDVLFYALGVYCFYNEILLSVLVILIMTGLMKWSHLYLIDPVNPILNAFMEFLNQLHSHLSVGESFRAAIIAQKHSDGECLKDLNKLMGLNATDEQLLKTIESHYPVPEAIQFNKLLKGAMHSSHDATKVVSVTLDQLFIKTKTSSEADMILFQKKIEHTVLTLAPLVVILMIHVSAPTYLDIMYETLSGQVVMTLAFVLLIAMKHLGTSIINIRW